VNGSQVRLASVKRRFIALLIDGILIAIVVGIAASITAAIAGSVAHALRTLTSKLFAGVVAPAAEILYAGVLLQHGGQTIGKMLLGVKVTRPDGTSISTAQAWGRSIVAGLFVNLLALIDCLPALFTPDRTAIHDIFANTRVVRVR
jgi:uncharacterized RDD family membrane protein YckC